NQRTTTSCANVAGKISAETLSCFNARWPPSRFWPIIHSQHRRNVTRAVEVRKKPARRRAAGSAYRGRNAKKAIRITTKSNTPLRTRIKGTYDFAAGCGARGAGGRDSAGWPNVREAGAENMRVYSLGPCCDAADGECNGFGMSKACVALLAVGACTGGDTGDGAAGMSPRPNICVNSPIRFGPELPGAWGLSGWRTAGLCGKGPGAAGAWNMLVNSLGCCAGFGGGAGLVGAAGAWNMLVNSLGCCAGGADAGG